MDLGIPLVLCLDMLESMDIHHLVCNQLHVKEREKFTKLEHRAKIELSSYDFDKKYFGTKYRLTFFADSLWISNKSMQTFTDGSMISDGTFGISSTSVSVAWVLTFFVDTS